VRAIVGFSGRDDLQPSVLGAPGKYEYEYLSSDRAKRVLGWRQQYSLDAGLRETYEWYRQAREQEAVPAGA
jgi:nucleoside-diphosphate-sugar epimerase